MAIPLEVLYETLYHMIRASSANSFLHVYPHSPSRKHIVKLGFTGVYIFFLISAQSIDCGF